LVDPAREPSRRSVQLDSKQGNAFGRGRRYGNGFDLNLCGCRLGQDRRVLCRPATRLWNITFL
jgi:hypothetical protein